MKLSPGFKNMKIENSAQMKSEFLSVREVKSYVLFAAASIKVLLTIYKLIKIEKNKHEENFFAIKLNTRQLSAFSA